MNLATFPKTTEEIQVYMTEAFAAGDLECARGGAYLLMMIEEGMDIAGVGSLDIRDIEVSGPAGTFLVLTDEEADSEAKDRIRDLVWAFRPEFLAEILPATTRMIRALQEFGDDCNDLLLSALGDDGMDQLVRDAIGCDGRGHFLSDYDGEEVEISLGFGAWMYAYRQG